MNIKNYLESRELPPPDTIVKTKGLTEKIKSFSGDLIDKIVLSAVEPSLALSSSQVQAIELLMPMMMHTMQNECVTPLLHLKGKTVDEQVEVVMTAVSEGGITFKQGEQYLELITKGSDLTDMRDLQNQLEALVDQGKL